MKTLLTIICALTFGIGMTAQQPNPTPKVTHFIPTSELVRVAAMAARDEGFNPEAQGVFLDELRTANCGQPIPGYASIALFQNSHAVRTYSVRVDTGDVVDENACVVFRYPNLMKFRQDTLKGFGTTPVSLEAIAAEVGCEKLHVLPHEQRKRDGCRSVAVVKSAYHKQSARGLPNRDYL